MCVCAYIHIYIYICVCVCVCIITVLCDTISLEGLWLTKCFIILRVLNISDRAIIL